MAREASVSPRFLTRKGLNLWSTYKARAGDMSDAELPRSGQVSVLCLVYLLLVPWRRCTRLSAAYLDLFGCSVKSFLGSCGLRSCH